jgi:hypothetical protein
MNNIDNLFFDVSNLIQILNVFEERKSQDGSDITVRNEGKISFANVAVWLIVYQMLNAQEKQACINAIIDRSKGCNIESRSIDIENLINKLNTTQNIKTLIQAYGNEGINLTFGKQAEKAGCLNNLDNELRDWLEQNQYLKIDNSQDAIDGKQLSIEMKKDIFFQWNQRGYPLKVTSGKFCGQQKKDDFLEFRGADCKVLVTEYEGRKWLAIEKEAFKKSTIESRDSTNMPGEDYSSFFQNNNQEISGPDGNAILFAPILIQEERSIYKKEDAKSSRALQDYCAKILNQTNLHKLYLQYMNIQSQNQDIDNYKDSLLNDELMQKIKVSFKPSNKIKTCKFPNLKNQWVGTKAKIALVSDAPSMFAPLFSSGAKINCLDFDAIVLKCKLALRYDENGGQVKNKIKLVSMGGATKEYDAYKIVIDRPFAFCYQQQHQDGLWDAYCFAVSDPYGQKKITSISNNGVELKEMSVPDAPATDFSTDSLDRCVQDNNMLCC